MQQDIQNNEDVARILNFCRYIIIGNKMSVIKTLQNRAV